MLVLLAKHRHFYPSFTRICNNWTLYIWYWSKIGLLADVVDEAWRASDLHGSIGPELEHANKLLWGTPSQSSDLSNYQASPLKLSWNNSEFGSDGKRFLEVPTTYSLNVICKLMWHNIVFLFCRQFPEYQKLRKGTIQQLGCWKWAAQQWRHNFTLTLQTFIGNPYFAGALPSFIKINCIF